MQADNNNDNKSNSVEKCTNCGLCKAVCPVFLVEKKETVSPRGKANLIKNDFITKVMFDCTLCNACKKTCPMEIDVPAQIRLARQKITTDSNEEMIKNVREAGNPFGKDTGKIKDLHCC
ncbi:MAG: (Fe-S)-binding protein [Candidatus Diapherotrites archaeon]|nr:(Fe-S)-binding protein [Candidatus Diapherotrites archaeon]